MRKLILLISLLACSPAWASYALVSNVKAVGASTTSSGINTTGATILLSYSVTFGTTPCTPTDSNSNVWVAVGTDSIQGNSHGQWWYVKNPTVGASHTVTTCSSGFPSIFMAAFSGADTSSPLDQSNKAGTASSTTVTLPSTTPSQNGELIVVGLSNNSSDTPTIDSGFTVQDTQMSTSSEGVAWAYLIQGTAAAVAPQWTTPGANDKSASIATFKPTGGATPAKRHRGTTY
jgi:hypothetical protein